MPLIPLILPNFVENQVFAVLLAEPISDILAAIITCTIFFVFGIWSQEEISR